VQKLFQGIPQKANTLGAAAAPVTMVEYVDLQCPFCREFETEVLPTLVRRYVRTGKLRIEMRLLAFIGPDSVGGRYGALAAGEQNRQFNFAELLYFNQGTENTGWLDSQMIDSAATSIPGLIIPRWQAAEGSASVKANAAALDAAASAAGVDSTPTILVGRTGTAPTEVSMTSATDIRAVTSAIDAALG
jgi:protein-disulfide isomerase